MTVSAALTTRAHEMEYFVAIEGIGWPTGLTDYTAPINTQFHTDYDNSPTTEGTFTGGAGYSVADVITLSDGSLIAVNAVSGGAVTQFEIDSQASVGASVGVALTQDSVAPTGGTGFTLTPDTDNIETISPARFDGDVFVTDDLNSNLATLLGCTIHKGLYRPSGVSDSINVRTSSYSPGSMRINIQDQDDFIINAIKPHTVTGTSGTLSTGADGLTYSSTTVLTDESWGSNAVIWIAGREAIKLGPESGAGPYTYTGSTRGYLGTPRGRQDTRPTALSSFSWEDETRVDDYCRIWQGRRCIVYMHVPGESADNVVRVYTGIIKAISTQEGGNIWSFATNQDTTANVREMHYSQLGCKVLANSFIEPDGRGFSQFSGTKGAKTNGGVWVQSEDVQSSPSTLNLENAPSVRRLVKLKPDPITWYDRLALASAYNYRNLVSGGTKGMRASADGASPRTPQAHADYNSRLRLDSLMMVGEGNYVRALYKREQGDATADYDYTEIVTEVTALDLGSNFLDLYDDSGSLDAKFLLDNYSPDPEKNRFAINRDVNGARNPINLLLMFLTTMNNEFQVLDATGGTETVINFASNSFKTNEWAGYCLYRVEGSGKGEGRVISSNATNTITVDRPFSAVPASGNEFQVRNTIYDVLPIGWGLGVHNSNIDLSSFEDIREKNLAGAMVGQFAIGAEPELNMWQLLVDNICKPYGIVIFLDRATGKLTAKYLSSFIGNDGITEDYTEVTADKTLSIGNINYFSRTGAAKAMLKVRDSKNRAIKIKTSNTTGLVRDSAGSHQGQQVQVNHITSYSEENVSDILLQSKGIELPFIIGEKELTIEESKYDEITLTAMFDTEQSVIDFLVGRVGGLLEREANPPPETTIKIDMSYLLTVQVGTILNITIADNSKWNPVNPLTGSHGWTNVVARVLGTSLDFSESQPGIECTIELLDTVLSGRVASAANVDGKGNDGSGDYFTVHFGADSADYSEDKDQYDWRGFAVGDYIELRDSSGAVKNAGAADSTNEFGTVKGFGSNLEASPEDANNGRVYVTGTISTAIAAGDYITLQSWDADTTSRMKNYAAYADSNEQVGPSNEEARIYE